MREGLPKTVISEEELAEFLAISLEHAQELRRKKEWPHLRLSRRTVKYLPEHVLAIVEDLEVLPRERQPDSGLPTAASLARRRRIQG